MKNTMQYIRRLLLGLLAAGVLLSLAAGIFYGVKGYGMYREAIEEKSLEERVEEIRDREDFTPYAELPHFYVQATISVEDHRFYHHRGIDLIAIGRAAWKDIRAMSFEEGGSTITQQLAKNMLFTTEKKLERKAAEVFAVWEIESKYTKEEIFETYVNIDYFGSGYHGIGQAAEGYYGKEPLDLTNAESVLLAGVLNSPSAYSPRRNKERAHERAKQVLKSMVRNNIITRDEARAIAVEIAEQIADE